MTKKYSKPRVRNIDRTESICEICGKICIGPKQLKSHKTQVHYKKNIGTKKRGRPPGFTQWNKGLTAQTDERVLNNTISMSKTIRSLVAEGKWTLPTQSIETRQQTSLRQSLNNSGGKCKWYEVNGVKVQGRWERDFAIFCGQNGIEWNKLRTHSDVWYYHKNNIRRQYTPDFYLPEYDAFIEIKGHWWGDDKEKMKMVLSENRDKEIVILRKKELDLIWNSGVSGLRDCLKSSRIRFDSEGFHQMLQ